ncbi:MAG: YheT family hydrolase [Pyrinomonadaceae bacterium]
METHTNDLTEIARALEAVPFRPHRLFRGGHAQTLFAYAFPRLKRLLRAARGDEARLFQVEPDVSVLARCRWQPDREAAPTMLIVHGLEGSSESVYMLGTADKAYRAGFNALRMNIRTCGGTEHLAPTLYHSGMTQDISAVVRELSEHDGFDELYLAGFSLGGNQSLKFAGESGDDAPRALCGVCAVSPSLDLSACAAAISRRSNALYNQSFVLSLKRRMRRAARLYPERYDARRLKQVSTVREFDEIYTAPHGGFRDADDYYARSSALQFVPSIRVPTLVIHADDDPFVPFDSFRHPSLRENPQVVFLAPRHGGHVGFVADAPHGEDRFWAENRIVQFCRLLHERAVATAA